MSKKKEKYIVYAPGVNSGGGGNLLKALLEGCKKRDALLIGDQRFASANANEMRSQLYPNSAMGRLKAELHLRQVSDRNTKILCFANIPPLFPNPANISIYFQNELILSSPKRKFALLAKLLKISKRSDHVFYCQTLQIADGLKQKFGIKAFHFPFLANETSFPLEVGIKTDNQRPMRLLYPSSTSPHKNHAKLLEAWRQSEPLPGEKLALTATRDQLTIPPGLADGSIDWLGWLNADKLAKAFDEADAMIFPSLNETIGLPLIEAHIHNTPVLASQLPFASQFISPFALFDPEHPSSISESIQQFRSARASAKSSHSLGELVTVLGPESFLEAVFD